MFILLSFPAVPKAAGSVPVMPFPVNQMLAQRMPLDVQAQHFQEIYAFLQAGAHVLVVCKNGKHRSLHHCPHVCIYDLICPPDPFSIFVGAFRLTM